MSKIQIEVELEQDGQSLKGAERFKGQAVLPDGRKVYVKVYGAAPEKKVDAKPPTVRKAKEESKVETKPATNPLAGFSEAQLALLAKVMAQLKQG